jgi:hypothetical protein
MPRTLNGQVVGVSIEIYDFSTPDDHQLLVTSFEKGQNSGLVNTLSKMKAVGHCSITGTLGYDVSFIRMTPTPTGRKIRWVTNRQLRMGEVYTDSQSQSFNLTAGEFEINDTGIFDEHRYFDVFAEYAKAAPEDILIRLIIALAEFEKLDPPDAEAQALRRLIGVPREP